MLNEPLNGFLERSLLCSFRLGVTQVATNSKPMGTSFIVIHLVSIGKFSLTENLVSFGLTFVRELNIGSATVDKERYLGFFEVCLFGLFVVSHNSRLHTLLLTSRSSGTFNRDGWETTLTLMSFSNARSKT